MTRVYGVLGWPVAHSRSPAMLNAAFAAAGVDASYVRFPVAPDALADAVRGLRALGIAGANVTVPHKTSVLPLLDSVDDAARAIGAVNTVVRGEDGRLHGLNTDAGGLVRALVEAGARLEGARALVLGAGAEVTVAARRQEAARALWHDALSLSDDTGLRTALTRADVVVHATSATLLGDDDRATRLFLAQLPLEALRPGTLITDLVYTPRDTALLRAARAHGARTLDGTAMLLHQGALAFERWTGLPAPLEAMRAALDAPASA